MHVLRVLVAWSLIGGLSASSTFAGDLGSSIARAAEQEAQARPAKVDNKYLWPGYALFVGGMAVAVYGFLHTKGGDAVSGEVSKESKTEIGGAGLAVAGLGGALLYLGSQHSKRAPAITVGVDRIAVSKRVSW
jgi:hypothetical protein